VVQDMPQFVRDERRVILTGCDDRPLYHRQRDPRVPLFCWQILERICAKTSSSKQYCVIDILNIYTGKIKWNIFGQSIS